MATGSHSNGRRAARHSDLRFEVSYEAKATEESILRGAGASLRKAASFGRLKHDNRLIAGDNLRVMRSLLRDKSVAGKARLVYIDPPFATGFRFESAKVGVAFHDHEVGAAYLESLRRRLLVIRELLSEDGSIYVHLDATMLFPVKLIMDEVFGAIRFRNLITRVKCNPKNQARRHYGDECDYLLFYTKSAEYVWNQPVAPWEPGEGEQEYHCIEEGTGRHFKKVPCHLPGLRNGETGKPWRGRMPPPGKHWVHAPAKLDELDRQGKIYWSPTGNPRRKLYLDEAPGKRRSNLWTDFRDVQNQNARVTGYPTEKNIEMLRMIVEASSSPDDLVLDAFVGSGAALAAAGSLGRRWIGIDNSAVAIKTSVDRLLHGTPRMGSYAKKTYIKRARGESLPDADTAFTLWVDVGDAALSDKVESLKGRNGHI